MVMGEEVEEVVGRLIGVVGGNLSLGGVEDPEDIQPQ